MDENETESVERSTEELDALADQAESSRNDSRPMVQEEQKTPEPTPEQQLIEFVHNGKAVKAPIDQVIKWAQQGYDYPQKLQKLNQERAQWEQQRHQLDSKYKVYQDIDSWASKNPQQWERLEHLWKSGQITQSQAMESAQAQSEGLPATDPYAERFKALETQNHQIAQYVNELIQERQQIQAKQEDEGLDKTIQSIREKHKDLDWNTLDDQGKSLEVRLLEHAQSLGLKDGSKAFQLAFKDLLHDQLIESAASKAKINVSRNIQSQRKAGVLGESPTSSKIPLLSAPKNIRDQSYEELMREAMSELNIKS